MLERWVSQWLEFFRWFNGKKRPGKHVIRTSSAALDGLHLPPRSYNELDASVFQRQKLEDLGEHDFAVLDSLGREQAKYLLYRLEREVAEREEQAQLAEARGFISNVIAVLCLGTIAVVGMLTLRDRPKQEDAPAATVSPTPNPAAEAAAVTAAEFQRRVADSQTRAVRAHPSLGVAGSHFNAAFTARYKRMVQQQDARLASPDWPERLAEECSRQLPAAYQ